MVREAKKVEMNKLKAVEFPKVRKHTKETYQAYLDAKAFIKVDILEFNGSKKEGLIRYRCCGKESPIVISHNLTKIKTCRFCEPVNRKLTVEEVHKTLNSHNLKLIEGSDIPRYRDKIKIQYSCGCIRKTTFGSIRDGQGLRCGKHENRIVNKVFSLDTANEMLKNANFSSSEIVSGYKGLSLECEIRCLLCGYVSISTPNNTLKRISGCHVCGRKGSFKERLLRMVLLDLGVTFESEKTFHWLKSDEGANLYYDTFIPDLNLAIEYDGGYHSNKGTKELDKLKDRLSSKNGVKVERIPVDGVVSKMVIDIIEGAETIPKGSTL